MTPTIEIRADGLQVLSGRPVDDALAEAALEWIDDPVGLYEDRPVSVPELWRAVMVAAVGRHCDAVVLVHPDGWPRHRLDRVIAAANAVADEVVPVPRRRWNPDPEAAGVADLPVPHRRVPAAAAATAILAGTVVALIVAAVSRPAPSTPAMDTQAVVEGRIAISVPPDWTVTRVTDGPGSRRLQAGPPGDPDIAVHVTQSYAPDSTLPRAADALRRRIADQPPGVFVDFRVDGSAAGRPAVTYREVRPGRVVDWSVVLIGSTLLGIGCQGSDGARDACERVLASAHESGTDREPGAF